MLCLALLPLSYSNSQTTDSTTSNLINYSGSPTDTTSTWNNGVYVNQLCFQYGQPGNCGPNPSIRDGNNINFSYGLTDLNQVVNINRALAVGGTGVQLSGFNFGFMAKNGNGWDDGRQDYLAAYVKLYGSAGNQIANYDYSSQTNQRYNWTQFNFNETFVSPQLASQYSTAKVGFIGRDNNFWAGNYGPEIYNVSFNLKYRVDPCATNPAYATTCAGFSSVVTGTELFDTSRWNPSITQAVAINTALTNAGIGATVHGFKYSFNYNVGQSWSGCTATNQDGSCSWYMDIPASVRLTASLTNNNNQSLYQKSYTLTGDGTSGTVNGQYLLSSSLNQTALGSIRMSGSSTGADSSLGNFSANLMYTPDPCSNNPLYSTSCLGYNAAFAKQFIPSSTTNTTSTVSAPENISTQAVSTAPQGQTQMAGVNTTDTSGPVQQQTQPALASSAPITSTAPTATNPQPKPGDVQIAGSNKSAGGSSSGPSALAMSVVASVQAKVNATEKATVQQANEAAATATAQAVQLAESVAGSAQATSIASSMSTANSSSSGKSAISTQSSVGSFSLQTTSQASSTSVNALKPYTPQTDAAMDNSSFNSAVTGFDVVKIYQMPETQTAMVQPQQQITIIQPQQTQQVQQSAQIYQAPVQQIQPVVSYSLTEPSIVTFDTGKKIETPAYTEIEIPRTDSFRVGTRGTLNEYMNEQPFMALMGIEPTQDGMVKRNVQPNEIAGGVDIAAMATQPKGYDAYAMMTLKDVAFYKVEEVYKNQKTVDNMRLLRGLTTGSDRRHQEMINQQYKN